VARAIAKASCIGLFVVLSRAMCRKHQKHGMNFQVIASPDGDIL
jgi:hypothetical protein